MKHPAKHPALHGYLQSPDGLLRKRVEIMQAKSGKYRDAVNEVVVLVRDKSWKLLRMEK